ncbi:MAG: hypothetical protein GEU82_12470 [Luteitalea sp.]|nr:hypothetical protein [Luteitalea sp.]
MPASPAIYSSLVNLSAGIRPRTETEREELASTERLLVRSRLDDVSGLTGQALSVERATWYEEHELDERRRTRRPLLGYPSVVFTGKYADPIPLLQAASDAAVGRESFGIPDPDVTRVRVDVEVRTLRMDNLLSLSGNEAYIHLYTTDRDFPADVDAPRTIPLGFREARILHFGDPNDFGDTTAVAVRLATGRWRRSRPCRRCTGRSVIARRSSISTPSSRRPS